MEPVSRGMVSLLHSVPVSRPWPPDSPGGLAAASLSGWHLRGPLLRLETVPRLMFASSAAGMPLREVLREEERVLQ